MLKVYGVGTVVSEPKLVKLEKANTHVCNLRLAFNQVLGSGENQTVQSHYFDFVLWDSGAEAAANRLKVGDKVFVDGVAQLQTWKDDEGNDKSRVVFRVSQFTPIPKQVKAE